jgi:hypothetical protein
VKDSAGRKAPWLHFAKRQVMFAWGRAIKFLIHSQSKSQIVIIVTGVASDWEYFWPTTIKRQSAGGKHD